MIMTPSVLKGVLSSHVLGDSAASLAIVAGELLMEYVSTDDLTIWLSFLDLHDAVQMYEDEITYRVRLRTGVDFGQMEKGTGFWDE